MSTITERARITTQEFGRMLDAGVFGNRKIELLDGELYEVTRNPPHNYAVDLTAWRLRVLLEPLGYIIREEKSIEPWEDWWPEPDVAVLRGPRQRYAARHPGPADILLLCEVCENSPQDRTKKLAGYAAAGFPVYWILDLELRRLEVYADPSAGAYAAPVILRETESVDVTLAGRVVGQIAVADLLP